VTKTTSSLSLVTSEDVGRLKFLRSERVICDSTNNRILGKVVLLQICEKFNVHYADDWVSVKNSTSFRQFLVIRENTPSERLIDNLSWNKAVRICERERTWIGRKINGFLYSPAKLLEQSDRVKMRT
jgi:hypothetical protein